METDTRTDRVHLHRDDYPKTLQLLEDLIGVPLRAGTAAGLGFEPTEHGAYVNWDQLLGSWLSSTEKAVVHIARGTAGLERAGGPAPRLRARITGVVAGVCGGARGDEWMAAITGGVDARRLDELDPDLARQILDIDEAAQDLLLHIGASDITDADRADHATKMRRQLAALTVEITALVEELQS